MKISPLAAILAASTLVSAQAAEIPWNNLGTGSFLTPSNWFGNVVPTTADDALIENTGTATLGSFESAAVSRLLVNNGALSLNGGSISTVSFGTFESPGAYVIGGAGGTGTVTAIGDSFLTGGRVRIGVNGGTGSVTLSGGSIYSGDSNQDTWVGAAGSTGSLTLNDQAKWNISNDWITVGNSGAGTLTLNNASELNVLGGNVVFGAGSGTGTVNLSGSSKIFTDTGEIWMANDGGTANVDVSGTASITAAGNWIAVGRFANGASNGTLTIRENGVVQKTGGNGNVVVGPDGHGVVNVQDNGTFSSNNQMWFGEQDDGNGTLNLSGGNVSSGGDFVVAQGGGSEGQVNATGGTITVGGWTKLGFNANAVGQMNVSGTATVNTTGTFIMGDDGIGTLTQQGGTINTTGETWVGQNGQGQGTFNLEGGSYTSGAWIAVGRSGAKGNLNVSGGSLTHTGTGQVDGANLTGSNFVLNGNAGKVAEGVQSGGTITNTASVFAIGADEGNVATMTATGGTGTFADTRIGHSGVGTLTIDGSANYTSTSVYMGSNATGDGTLNLNGGTYTVNFIEEGAGNGHIVFDGGILRAAQDVVNLIRDFEAGDVVINEGGLSVDTNGKTVGIEHALEGVGGLNKLGAGVLTLSGANTYQGNTIVSAGTLSSTTASFGDFSSINIVGTAILDLNFLGTDSIGVFYLDGIAQAAGVWGAIGSGAQFQTDRITGTGTLTTSAIPEPSTVALVIGGVALVGLRMRSRARANQA